MGPWKAMWETQILSGWQEIALATSKILKFRASPVPSHGVGSLSASLKLEQL